MSDLLGNCMNCRRPVAEGEVYFRLMLALHKNSGSRHYVSKKRTYDACLCQDCTQAALKALDARSPRIRRVAR